MGGNHLLREVLALHPPGSLSQRSRPSLPTIVLYERLIRSVRLRGSSSGVAAALEKGHSTATHVPFSVFVAAWASRGPRDE